MNETPRKDPLAGFREEINAGDRDVVTWPDDGTGCPVDQGQVFRLRSCTVQVGLTKRVQRGREWLWLARLRVLRADQPKMLTRGLRLTSDPRQAIKSGEEHGSTTLQSTEPLDNVHNLYAPPEGEIVPHEDVLKLPSTVAARRRYEESRQETIRKNLDRSLASQLREVGVRARNTGVDLGREYEELEDVLGRMKSKVRQAA